MRIAEVIRKAKRVYIIGNGGSYANAAHIANDFLEAGIKAHTLDPATLTAWANDHGYENVFARWVEKVGEKGDLLIALSGSGASTNIWLAIESAIGKGMKSIAVFGDFRHEEAADFSPTHTIRFGKDMQAAEDYQVRWGHSMMRELKCA